MPPATMGLIILITVCRRIIRILFLKRVQHSPKSQSLWGSVRMMSSNAIFISPKIPKIKLLNRSQKRKNSPRNEMNAEGALGKWIMIINDFYIYLFLQKKQTLNWFKFDNNSRFQKKQSCQCPLAWRKATFAVSMYLKIQQIIWWGQLSLRRGFGCVFSNLTCSGNLQSHNNLNRKPPRRWQRSLCLSNSSWLPWSQLSNVKETNGQLALWQQ